MPRYLGIALALAASAAAAEAPADISAIEVVPQVAGYIGRNIAFSPDGKLVAFAHWVDSNNSQGMVTVWDLSSLRMIRMLGGGVQGIERVEFSASGLEVSGGNVTWDVESGRRLAPAEVAARGADKRAARFQGKPGETEVEPAPGIWLHDSTITKAYAIDPTGRYAVRTDQFGWDNHLVDRRNGSFQEGFRGLAFAPELATTAAGHILFAGSSGPVARVWDLTTGSVIFEHSTLGKGPIARPSIVLARSGSTALIQGAGPDGRGALIRDLAHPEKSYLIEDPLVQPLSTRQRDDLVYYPACISADGARARVTSKKGTYDDTYVEWDVVARKAVGEFKKPSGATCTFDPPRDAAWRAIPGAIKSPDGKLTARDCNAGQEGNALSASGSICLDGQEGAPQRHIVAHTAYLMELHFSADGRFLISRSRDGTTKLWNPQTLALVATAVTSGNADYVIYTPDNYYMAGGGGLSAVAFRAGTRAYPFEQFDLQLNRPDVVLARLGLADTELIAAYRTAHDKRLKVMNKTEEELRSLRDLPELTITDRPYLQVTEPTAKIGIAVRGKSPIVRLHVHVNEVPIYGSGGLPLAPTLELSKTIEVELELKRPNRVRISAVDAAGRESLAEELEIKGGVAPAKNDKGGRLAGLKLQRKPDLYLLSIGVSNYKNPDYTLHYAAKDAKDLAALFAKKQVVAKGWKPKTNRVDPPEYFGHLHERLLTDAKATRENILAARSFLEKAAVEDVVIVFAAGHGLVDEKREYYFGTVDIDAGNPSARGLSFADLEKLVDGLRSRKRLVILDTCHGGELDDEGAPSNAVQGVAGAKVTSLATRGIKIATGKPRADVQRVVTGELFGDLRRRSGASVLASSAGAEVALESPQWNNGVFTYSLMEALDNRADFNDSYTTDLDELINYVGARVRNLTGGAQHPTMRQGNFGNSFPVLGGVPRRDSPKWGD